MQFTQARQRITEQAPTRARQKQEADMTIPATPLAATMFTTLVVSLAIQAGYYACCLMNLSL